MLTFNLFMRISMVLHTINQLLFFSKYGLHLLLDYPPLIAIHKTSILNDMLFSLHIFK